MSEDRTKYAISEEKIKEVLKAYHLIGEFLDEILPRELLYKDQFREGLDEALKEVESGKTREVHSFDDIDP
ncbi:MAG: hypothetical protein D6814_17445 [Calditrichaeota bacterium]|nr:MAG: hypothetical protein D6814_17445 [Calditrichota bacterium]